MDTIANIRREYAGIIAMHEGMIEALREEEEASIQAIYDACDHVDNGSMFYPTCALCGLTLG